MWVPKYINTYIMYKESLRESTSSMTTCPFFLVTSDISPELISCKFLVQIG